MYAPITSDIVINIGTILREISTGQLFTAVERLQGEHDISGEDIWRLIPTGTPNPERSSITLSRTELSEKFFAEED
jgi:hypothetical protein